MTDFRSQQFQANRITPNLGGVGNSIAKSRMAQDMMDLLKAGTQIFDRHIDLEGGELKLDLIEKRKQLEEERQIVEQAEDDLRVIKASQTHTRQIVDLMKERESQGLIGLLAKAGSDTEEAGNIIGNLTFTENRHAFAQGYAKTMVSQDMMKMQELIADNPATPLPDLLGSYISNNSSGNELLDAYRFPELTEKINTLHTRSLAEMAEVERSNAVMGLLNDTAEGYLNKLSPLAEDEAVWEIGAFSEEELQRLNSVPLKNSELYLKESFDRIKSLDPTLTDAQVQLSFTEMLLEVSKINYGGSEAGMWRALRAVPKGQIPFGYPIIQDAIKDIELRLERDEAQYKSNKLRDVDSAIDAIDENIDNPSEMINNASNAVIELEKNPGLDFRGEDREFSGNAINKRKADLANKVKNIQDAIAADRRVALAAIGVETDKETGGPILEFPRDEDAVNKYLNSLYHGYGDQKTSYTRAEQVAYSLDNFGILTDKYIEELVRLSNSPNIEQLGEAADMYMAIHQRDPQMALSLIAEKDADPLTGKTNRLGAPFAMSVRLGIDNTNPVGAKAPFTLRDTLELYQNTTLSQFNQSTANLKIGRVSDKEQDKNEQLENVNEVIKNITGRAFIPEYATQTYMDLYSYAYLQALELNDSKSTPNTLHRDAKAKASNIFKSMYTVQEYAGNRYVVPKSTAIDPSEVNSALRSLPGMDVSLITDGSITLDFQNAEMRETTFKYGDEEVTGPRLFVPVRSLSNIGTMELMWPIKEPVGLRQRDPSELKSYDRDPKLDERLEQVNDDMDLINIREINEIDADNTEMNTGVSFTDVPVKQREAIKADIRTVINDTSDGTLRQQLRTVLDPGNDGNIISLIESLISTTTDVKAKKSLQDILDNWPYKRLTEEELRIRDAR